MTREHIRRRGKHATVPEQNPGRTPLLLSFRAWIAKVAPARQQCLVATSTILLFLFIGVASVRNMSDTADEQYHLEYGRNILSLNSTRLEGDDSKMPITALNAVPMKLALGLPNSALRDFLESLLAARLVTLLFSGLVAIVVFSWGRALNGFAGGLAALVLYVCDPNIIAHSQLVTTDLYATGTTLFFFFYLWRFSRTHRLMDGLLAAVALGLALISKYSAVVLLPISILIMGLHSWQDQRAANAQARLLPRRIVLQLVVWSAAAAVICVLIINTGFLFNKTMMPLRDYQFQSTVLRDLKGRISLLNDLPTLLPQPFLQGLDRVIDRERNGYGYGRIYLLGQTRVGQGFKGYYLVASLLKVPLPSQLVVLLALGSFLASQKRRETLWVDEAFLLVPVLFFAVYYNFFFNAQIGIRFYLVIFPLLYVFAGGLFRDWARASVGVRWATALPAVYLISSILSYFPQYLAYFNELVWDRRMAYLYLADSNLNWGQGRYFLHNYMQSHPGARYEPSAVMTGRLVIFPDHLLGITGDPEKYAWLRENFKPSETVDYIYLVYRITPQDVAKLCETKGICP